MSEGKVIRIRCPNLACQRVLAVPAHARGKLVRCRGCSMTIRIPLPKKRDAEEAEETEETQEQEPAAGSA
ncbi:MAG: hypothetical protein JSV91_09450 [Phycisphaerales bacterium]|nr:MAG: hypothetical protein JSV91_09450 [Phycisphaerales bacterium]